VIRFLFGVAALAVAVAAAAQTFVVPPELWDRPRSGGTILAQPAIRQAVNAFLAQPGSRLVVHHAAGQEGLLAAEELRSWLVALAVDAGRISLRGGQKPAEPLRIELVKDDDRGRN
jgi:hypothetical protein